MLKSQIACVIGESMQVDGGIEGAGDVEVRGRVRGRLLLHDHLWVAQGGSVEAELRAEAATVDGSLCGALHITGSIDVRAGAEVAGSLRAETFVLSGDASFDGEVDMPVELPQQLAQG